MVENLVVSSIENAMRSLIATVLSVATLLSVSSSAFAQGAQLNPQTPQPTPQLTPQPTPQPTPSPTPSTAASSQPTTPADYMRAWPEPGRYHPCPASVGFGNGRSVCLGLDEPRRHVRHVASYGHYVPGGYGYYDFGPCRHCAAQRFYQSIEALTGCPVGFSMQYGACWPHTWPILRGAPFFISSVRES
jgi:hypothetical protein